VTKPFYELPKFIKTIIQQQRQRFLVVHKTSGAVSITFPNFRSTAMTMRYFFKN